MGCLLCICGGGPREVAPPYERVVSIESDPGEKSYVQMFISGKLIFPPDSTEHAFSHSNLTDLGFLGSGMYGSVHKMCYEKTKTLMAVKRVRIVSTRNDERETQTSELPKRIQTEIEAIKAASNCAQIVQFFGVTFHEGDCWVCMELMDASLEHIYKAVHSDRMGWNFFDETVLGGIAVSTIKALDHLKVDHHIIHRDVKPSNILMNTQGQIKLCDFGISGYLVDSVAMTGEVGCRPYMAPERLQSSSVGYDIRSDVWSLGITMVEVCTGVFPYGNFTEKPLFEQLQLVVFGDAPLLLDTAYSSRARNFINACLIKEVEHRPDFGMLMETDFFRLYNGMAEMEAHVANFVQRVLPHIMPEE